MSDGFTTQGSETSTTALSATASVDSSAIQTTQVTAAEEITAISSDTAPAPAESEVIITEAHPLVTTALPVTSASSNHPVTVTKPAKAGENPVEESAPVSPDYYNTCAFIGDSHVNGFQGYGIVPKSRVFAKDGMNITQVNTYINLDSVKAVNPENIYIMMGTNGVAWLDHKIMIEKYKAFINQIRAKMPDARIYIMAIPPVGANIEAKASVSEGRILNSEVDAYNNALLNMATEMKISYIDFNSSLKGADGMLPTEYSKPDGMHVVKAMYESIISPYILTHIVK